MLWAAVASDSQCVCVRASRCRIGSSPSILSDPSSRQSGNYLLQLCIFLCYSGSGVSGHCSQPRPTLAPLRIPAKNGLVTFSNLTSAFCGAALDFDGHFLDLDISKGYKFHVETNWIRWCPCKKG